MLRLTTAALGAITLLALGGCGFDPGGPATPESTPSMASTPASTGASDVPYLYVSDRPSEANMEALITGELVVQNHCYALRQGTGREADWLLLVPYGSQVVDDGRAVDIYGVGRYEVGETIHAVGGGEEDLTPDQIPPEAARCGFDRVVIVQKPV